MISRSPTTDCLAINFAPASILTSTQCLVEVFLPRAICHAKRAAPNSSCWFGFLFTKILWTNPTHRCRLTTWRTKGTSFGLSKTDLRLSRHFEGALRNLLVLSELSPEDIVGIAKAIRLVQRLPLSTP